MKNLSKVRGMSRLSKVAVAVGGLGLAAVVGAGPAFAAPAPDKATGSVTWVYQGAVTGQVTFNANAKTGGSLDYQNSNGQWLHGVVDPTTVHKLDPHTAVFEGQITSGSDDYQPGTGTFSAKVVDNSTSGRDGDMIAVYANAGPANDNPMTPDTAGIVTAGNLTVF